MWRDEARQNAQAHRPALLRMKLHAYDIVTGHSKRNVAAINQSDRGDLFDPDHNQCIEIRKIHHIVVM